MGEDLNGTHTTWLMRIYADVQSANIRIHSAWKGQRLCALVTYHRHSNTPSWSKSMKKERLAALVQSFQYTSLSLSGINFITRVLLASFNAGCLSVFAHVTYWNTVYCIKKSSWSDITLTHDIIFVPAMLLAPSTS